MKKSSNPLEDNPDFIMDLQAHLVKVGQMSPEQVTSREEIERIIKEKKKFSPEK